MTSSKEGNSRQANTQFKLIGERIRMKSENILIGKSYRIDFKSEIRKPWQGIVTVKDKTYAPYNIFVTCEDGEDAWFGEESFVEEVAATPAEFKKNTDPEFYRQIAIAMSSLALEMLNELKTFRQEASNSLREKAIVDTLNFLSGKSEKRKP